VLLFMAITPQNLSDQKNVHPDVHFINYNFNNKNECKVHERSHYILF
jgi:hypothetical protein